MSAPPAQLLACVCLWASPCGVWDLCGVWLIEGRGVAAHTPQSHACLVWWRNVLFAEDSTGWRVRCVRCGWCRRAVCRTVVEGVNLREASTFGIVCVCICLCTTLPFAQCRMCCLQACGRVCMLSHALCVGASSSSIPPMNIFVATAARVPIVVSMHCCPQGVERARPSILVWVLVGTECVAHTTRQSVCCAATRPSSTAVCAVLGHGFEAAVVAAPCVCVSATIPVQCLQQHSP